MTKSIHRAPVSHMIGISTWNDVADFFKKNVIPDVFVKRRLNFITIHYLYITGLAMLFSVIMYGIGDIPYIDALFFASGACTQSGLNTIDVNRIKTGQQVILYLGAMFCNPIVIHSSVVFIRLYWFEKKFENVVKEAKALRRTKSKGRTNSVTVDDVEAGWNDATFRERLNNLRHRRLSTIKKDDKETKEDNNSFQSSGDSPQEKYEEMPKTSRQNSRRSIDEMRLPQEMDPEQHISFLERQRNREESETLRIPSPREFDRGGRPINIDERLSEDGNAVSKYQTTDSKEDNEAESQPASMPAHLTFNVPEVPRDRTQQKQVPKLNARRTNTRDSHQSKNSSNFQPPPRTWTIGSFRRSNTAKTADPAPYLTWQPTVGRNSFFVGLTEEQREELGGIEYRALKTLALVLLFYFFFYHIFGILCLVPWIMTSRTWTPVVTQYAQGRVWWGIFTAASAFNDLGFTLTPDSMVEFQYAVFPLIVMSFLIIIGNTGFPCMLRFMIWLGSRLVPYGSGLWEELQFLLDHPRRCYTLLFPRAATWWLTFILVVLNGVDLIFFIVLDLNDETVTTLPGGIRFLVGLFQAASTRTAGFAAVNIANLHPAIQVSYLVMMYISVFPIAISMRRTNVYEEKSLGIYKGEDHDDDGKEPSYVGAHLRKQLSFDLWYVFLGLFVIAIVEGARLENTNEYAFTIFSVLFEIVSAYGTVGLSLGYPTINASFSAEFKTLSKLVIIAMQIRGRHRGLPYELDRAVLLPSQRLHETEAHEAERIMTRRASMAMSTAMSNASAVEGTLHPSGFRPETGLASGHDFDPAHPRERRRSALVQTNSNDSLRGHANHSGPVRQAFGTAMFKLATAPDVLTDTIKEEEVDHNSSSSS